MWPAAGTSPQGLPNLLGLPLLDTASGACREMLGSQVGMNECL